MSKIFKIPVTWEVWGDINVEAEDLDHAIRIFDQHENYEEGYPLPTEHEYVDGSFSRESVEQCQFNNEENE